MDFLVVVHEPVEVGLHENVSLSNHILVLHKNLVIENQSTIARLTPNQRQALAHSWRTLKLQLPSLTRRIFAELEVVCPKVKDVSFLLVSKACYITFCINNLFKVQIFYKASLVDCFVNKEPALHATLDEHVKYFVKYVFLIIKHWANR